MCRVMIIDLDAHQGNGHEKDFGNDGELCSQFFSCACCLSMLLFSILYDFCSSLAGRVYIMDMYNPGIYPFVCILTLQLVPISF